MKKHLIALAVAMVATTATSTYATTLYETDGTKIDLKGSVRVAIGKFGEEQRGDLRNDGSRVSIHAKQDMGNGLSGFASYELRFDGVNNKNENTFGNPVTKYLYGGVSHANIGSLSFGRQKTSADKVQLGDYTYVYGGNNNLVTKGEKVVKFMSNDFHGLTLGTDYIFGNAKKGYQASYKDFKQGYGSSLFYTQQLSDQVTLNVNAGFSKTIKMVNVIENYGKVRKTGHVTDWRGAAELDFGKFAIAANYGERKLSKEMVQSDPNLYFFMANGQKVTSTKKSALVGARLQIIEPSKVYVQWNTERVKITTSNYNKRAIIVGADYKLHKNVLAYAEYGYEYEKISMQFKHTKTRENKYQVGFRAYF